MGKLVNTVVKVGSLGMIDDATGQEGAEQAATAANQQGLSISRQNFLDQQKFLEEQRGIQRGDINTTTGDWRDQQLGYQDQLQDAMTAAANQRGALGGQFQADQMNTLGAYQDKLQMGLNATRGGQLDQLGQARSDVTGTLGGLSSMGNNAFGEAQGLAGSDLGVDITQDPGYQFRLSEGMKGIENSAAARGMQLSGSNLKDLGRFSQGLASQEYGAATQRAQNLRSERLNMLGQLGQTGAAAQSQQASQLGQIGVSGAGLTPDYARGAVNMQGGLVDPRAGAVDLTASIQDPGAIQAAKLSALSGSNSQYMGAGSSNIAQSGAAAQQYAQNQGAIGAQAATAGFNSLMSLGSMAGGVMTGIGAFNGGGSQYKPLAMNITPNDYAGGIV